MSVAVMSSAVLVQSVCLFGTLQRGGGGGGGGSNKL